MKTERELLTDLLDAANHVLGNTIDGGGYGPEETADDCDYPRDEDGDQWYWDFWELKTAIEATEEFLKQA